MPLTPDLDLVPRCVGSDAEPSTPIAFALSTALSARPHPPASAVLSAYDHPGRAELSTGWYVPTAGAWYEARAGRVPAPTAPITAREPAPTAPITARVPAPSAPITARVPAPTAPITAREPAPPRAPPAPITARADSLESRGEVDEEADDRQSVAISGNQWQSGEVEEEADEQQQRLQTSEVEGGAQHGASDRSDEDSSDGWETVSEDG